MKISYTVERPRGKGIYSIDTMVLLYGTDGHRATIADVRLISKDCFMADCLIWHSALAEWEAERDRLKAIVDDYKSKLDDMYPVLQRLERAIECAEREEYSPELQDCKMSFESIIAISKHQLKKETEKINKTYTGRLYKAYARDLKRLESVMDAWRQV